MSDNAHPEVIEAAGGILWRHSGRLPEVAVVHRPGHRDWSFPKGKREPGESWQQTALREVHEETGCEAEIQRFASGTIYTVGGRPKIVLYWHMTLVEEWPFTPNEEVDQLAWMTPEAALERLDYESERRLLTREAIGERRD